MLQENGSHAGLDTGGKVDGLKDESSGIPMGMDEFEQKSLNKEMQ